MPLASPSIEEMLVNGQWTVDFFENKRYPLRFTEHGVDVTLHPTIKHITHKPNFPFGPSKDVGAINPYDQSSFIVEEHDCTNGFVLEPGNLYLASVRERFNCSAPLVEKWLFANRYVFFQRSTHYHQMIDGRSTLARMGLAVHKTCGKANYNFSSTFTLELSVMNRIELFAGMRIANISFEPIQGEIDVSKIAETPYDHSEYGPVVPVLGRERF